MTPTVIVFDRHGPRTAPILLDFYPHVWRTYDNILLSSKRVHKLLPAQFTGIAIIKRSYVPSLYVALQKDEKQRISFLTVNDQTKIRASRFWERKWPGGTVSDQLGEIAPIDREFPVIPKEQEHPPTKPQQANRCDN